MGHIQFDTLYCIGTDCRAYAISLEKKRTKQRKMAFQRQVSDILVPYMVDYCCF